MVAYDLERAKQAVQFLVDSSYFAHHLKKLRSTVSKPRSMPFKDDAEVLNELLVIGRQNLQAMENLIQVAEIKRDDRNAYQRHYMAAKRQRDRKVIELEEVMVGKKLSVDDRAKVLLRQYSVWNKERLDFLEKLGEASWLERNDKLKDFWTRKEREIDALLAEAKLQGGIKRKYVVRVEAKPKTAFGEKLAQAVKPR
jgi:hypothetical protein